MIIEIRYLPEVLRYAQDTNSRADGVQAPTGTLHTRSGALLCKLVVKLW